MSILVTRPEYDPGTRYLSCWAKLIIEKARNKGQIVFDLKGIKANRSELESRVKKLRPSFIFLNGHGTEVSVYGQDDEPVIVSGKNDNILQETIIYTVACSSGKELGRIVGDSHQSTFIGYDRRFGIVRQNSSLNRPLEDPYAKPILETSNQIPSSLIKGNSCSVSIARARETGQKHLRAMQSSLADPNILQVAQVLRWNMQHLVCHGDGEKKL